MVPEPTYRVGHDGNYDDAARSGVGAAPEYDPSDSAAPDCDEKPNPESLEKVFHVYLPAVSSSWFLCHTFPLDECKL